MDCNVIYHFNKWFKINKVNVSPFFLLWETNKQFKLIRKLQKTYDSDKDSLIEGTEEFDHKILIELKQEIYSMKISEIKELLSNTTKLEFDNKWYLGLTLRLVQQLVTYVHQQTKIQKQALSYFAYPFRLKTF